MRSLPATTVRQRGGTRRVMALACAVLAVLFLAATIGNELTYAQKRGSGGGFRGGGFGGGGYGGGGFGGFRQAPTFRPPPPTFKPRPPAFRPPPVAPRVSAPRSLPRPALPGPRIGTGSQSIPKLGGAPAKVPQAIRPTLSGSATSSRLAQARRSVGNKIIQSKGKNYRIPQRGISTALRRSLEPMTSRVGLSSAWGEAERKAFHQRVLRIPEYDVIPSKSPAKRKGPTVIGQYPAYTLFAEAMKHRQFYIPQKIWERMSEKDLWKANERFLERTVRRQSVVILAKPFHQINPESYLAREVNYLLGKGYRFSSDGTKLLPPKQGK